MVDKDDFHLDYRRYAARAGIPITPPKNPQVQENEHKSDEKLKTDTPALTPYQVFRAAAEKLESTPLTKGNVNEYQKMLSEFIRLGYELEEYDTTIEYMKKYLGKRPRDNGIRHNLAMVYLKIGNRKKCKLELRQILKNDPKFKPAREMLEKFRKGEG